MSNNGNTLQSCGSALTALGCLLGLAGAAILLVMYLLANGYVGGM
jgi:hypothetical protein